MSRPQEFFFDPWTTAACLADATVNGADAGAQFRESASDGGTIEARNPGHSDDAAVPAIQREQSRK